MTKKASDLLVWSVLLATIPVVFADLDFFSSTLKTKDLLEHHRQIVDLLREYAAALDETSSILNRYLSESELQKVSEPWANDGDPLKTFVLIRRTTADLDSITAGIRKHRSLDPLLELGNLRQKGFLPSMDDLKGIAASVIRLQKTYLLQPKDIVTGNLSVVSKSSVRLSASDCLQLGQVADELTPPKTVPVDAKLWYQAGLAALQNETAMPNAENMETEAKLQERLQDIRNRSKKLFNIPQEFRDFLNKEMMIEPLATNANWEYVTMTYRRLCRGEQLRAPSMDKDNVCYFRQGPHPYMTIRPLKVEEKSLDPYLVVLHDIIGKRDINVLREDAVAKASRSSHVMNTSSGVSDIRVSATAWLPDPHAPALAERLGVFLGMNSNATQLDVEDFQVLNYGVGGHYSVHRDYFEDFLADRFHNTSGERIATLMIYLSDVEEGGATAFPYAGLALKPIKGAAAFWWNLRTDGTGDYRTTHGACPVIYGTKWVSNKWFRMRPQMFRVPCTLQRDDIVSRL